MNPDTKSLLENPLTECRKEKAKEGSPIKRSKREPVFSSSYKQQQLKPSTIKSTLGRDEHANELMDILGQHHKVIVYSQLGTGKTHFIKYCLSKWKYKNYCYISYAGNLKSTINKINIQNKYGASYNNIDESDLQNTTLSSSLLIIDNMYVATDISTELKQMALWSMDIVIITLDKITTDIFYNYELPPLNEEILRAIFTDITGMNFKNEHQKIRFSFITKKNVLLSSLVAYQCRKIATDQNKAAKKYKKRFIKYKKASKDCKKIVKSYFSDNLLEYILSKLETAKRYNQASFCPGHRYKIQYNRESLNLIEHTRFVYQQIMNNKKVLCKDNNSLCDGLSKTMIYLSYFGWTPIPRIFISKILSFNTKPVILKAKDKKDNFKYNKTFLTDLSKMGLLTLTDNTVQLSPLITHAVIASEKLAINDFNPIVENMIIFLESYESTLSIPYPSDALAIFAETLYNLVPEKNNPDQSKTSKQFEKWQKMIYLIFIYYNQNNAYDLAQRIIKLIKYPESPKGKHNFLDKSFFSISNNMHMAPKIPEIHEQIDQLCESLNASKNIKTLDMTNFITTVSDMFIDGYLYLFVNPAHEKEYTKKYKEYFFTVMDKFIFFIRSNNNSTYIRSSYAKEFYYISTYLLLKEKYLYPNDYYEYRIYNRLNKNINYAIRSLSITIILTGVSTMLLKDAAAFKHNLIPLTNILNDYINNCKLIPYHTFRLCIYAYIIAGMVQNVFISNDFCEIDDCYCSPLMNHENIHSLFNKCNLSKELYIDSIEKIDPILTKLESNMKSN